MTEEKISVEEKLRRFSEKMDSAGDQMSKLGGAMTVGCTIPILLVLCVWFFLIR